MPSRGQPLTLTYVAWDNGQNRGQTGDAGNHTLLWIKDGTGASPAGIPAEVNGAVAEGVYKIAITGVETQCDVGTLAGKSSTPNVVVYPQSIAFENLPTQAAGSPSGIPILDTNGQVPSNVMRWLSQNLAAPAHSGYPMVETAYSQVVEGYDGVLATADGVSVTFPVLDSRGNAIPDDSRFQYTLLKTLAGTGAGQVIGLGLKTGARKFAVAFGMNVTCGDDTQYGVIGSWRSQVQNRVTLDYADPVPTSSDPQTVGDVFNQSLASAVGREVIDIVAKTWTRYCRDDVTLARVFNLDDPANPLQRS